MGRISTYTQELADEICNSLAEGQSLRSICNSLSMPTKTTVMRWLADDRYIVFRDQYTRAREAQADFYAEEIIQIADDGSNDTYVDDEGNKRTDQDVIARSRLRKWYAGKLAPKKYGDKQTIDVNDITPPMDREQRLARIAELQAKVAAGKDE